MLTALASLALDRGAPPEPPPINQPSALETTLVAFAPYVGYALLAPILYWFFRRTWRELDVEALLHKQKVLEAGRWDARPAVVFAIVAGVLTLQQYFGGREVYVDHVRPYLTALERGETRLFGLEGLVDLYTYGELYAYAYWALTRVLGYTVLPLAVYKLCFPRDSLLDLGLRTRGLLRHAWIYGLCLLVVVPAVLIVAQGPEFGDYYPFYRRASRSWADLIAWEALYIAQFFGLEVFFRGFMLGTLRRSMGSAAIFAMTVPYCMIHFGKPYAETAGAVVAGIALGTVAMRTRSIYSGFLVHATVALLMDMLALAYRHGLPTELWPPARGYPILPG